MRKPSYHHGGLRKALIAAGVDALYHADRSDLSLRELARQVGVSPTAAYRHFASKEDLLSAISEKGFDELVARFRAAAEAAKRPDERLMEIGRAYVAFARERPTMFRLMFGGDVPIATLQKDKGRFGGPAFDALLQAAADRDDGHLSASQTLVRAVQAWSLVHGYAMLLIDGRLPAAVEDDTFLRQLLAPSAH